MADIDPFDTKHIYIWNGGSHETLNEHIDRQVSAIITAKGVLNAYSNWLSEHAEVLGHEFSRAAMGAFTPRYENEESLKIGEDAYEALCKEYPELSEALGSKTTVIATASFVIYDNRRTERGLNDEEQTTLDYLMGGINFDPFRSEKPKLHLLNPKS
ncbi:MAG: hypothetical protein ACE5FT_04120 [Candidatus Nanoarchaeia archaeon]